MDIWEGIIEKSIENRVLIRGNTNVKTGLNVIKS